MDRAFGGLWLPIAGAGAVARSDPVNKQRDASLRDSFYSLTTAQQKSTTQRLQLPTSLRDSDNPKPETMLAARDQENLVHGHQQVAAAKPLNQSTRGLQPKTPGNRFPKTPLKIPLQDENALGGFGKQSGKGKGLENMATGKQGLTFDKNAFVTPMGPRTRAPLGMKTTNAKAKALQTPAGPAPEKELEKTQVPKSSARRPKKLVHGDTVKLHVHGDESPLAERDVEYAPPKPKDLPYESEDFPRGCLNYDMLKPGNLMSGIHQTYLVEVDENGLTRMEREAQEGRKKAAKELDENMFKAMEEDWTIGDVPETFRHLKKKAINSKPEIKSAVVTRAPGTIASRKAASALSVAPKSAAAPPQTTQPLSKPSTSFLSRPKAAPITTNTSALRQTAATATSRSTIGYTKGRTASNVMHKRAGGFQRSASNMSQGSDTTITPATYVENANLSFLKAFDVDEEELEPGLRGVLPDCMRGGDDDDEFVFTIPAEV